jgi:hypothetical protein
MVKGNENCLTPIVIHIAMLDILKKEGRIKGQR